MQMSAVCAIVCTQHNEYEEKSSDKNKRENTFLCMAWITKNEWIFFFHSFFLRLGSKSFAFGLVGCCCCSKFIYFFHFFHGEYSRKITYVYEDKMMYDFFVRRHLADSPMIHSFIQNSYMCSSASRAAIADISEIYGIFPYAQWFGILYYFFVILFTLVWLFIVALHMLFSVKIHAIIQSKRDEWQKKFRVVDTLLMS